MKTLKGIAVAALLIVAFTLAGCTVGPTATPTGADVNSTASIVDSAAAFEKAIAADGTWIIALTKDLAIDKDLVLAGDFKNGKKNTDGSDALQRKVALYAQDADRNITARYTLTVKSLTVKSAVASLQHGTFVGDLIVDVDGFALIDTKVQGNVYFTTEAHKASFTMDADSSVSGVQEVRAAG